MADEVALAPKSPSRRVSGRCPQSLPATGRRVRGERLRWEALTSCGQERVPIAPPGREGKKKKNMEEKGKGVLTLVQFWLNSGCLPNPFLLSQGNVVLGTETDVWCFHGHPAASVVAFPWINYFRCMIWQHSSYKRHPFSVAESFVKLPMLG